MFFIVCSIWSGVMVGRAAFSRAASAATCGAAIEVPDMYEYEPLAVGTVLRIEPPGAAMAT